MGRIRALALLVMTFEGCFLSGVTTGGGPMNPEVPAEPTETASEGNAHFMQWDIYSANQTWLPAAPGKRLAPPASCSRMR